MKFVTARYTVRKVVDEDFNEGITYEINLKDGYVFSDDSHLAYATDYDDLKNLIADIKKEQS